MSEQPFVPDRKHILFALFIVAITLLAYKPVWHAGFIWDDDQHLTENPCIVGPLGFKGIWTTSAAIYYPLVLTSFWVQHALWGLNPAPYHVVNILMHAGCAVLLWRVLLALRVPGAWLGAALWALHPVQVESVAWISELKNTQSGVFYLMSMLFFVKWQHAAAGRSGRNGWLYVLVVLCAIAAILSKTSTVMLPMVLILCGWWLEGRWRWANLLWLAPLFLLSSLASGWTIWEEKFVSGAVGANWAISWPGRCIIAGKALWFYIGKLLWPEPLILIYPRWQIEPSQLLEYLPALAAAALTLALWRWRNNSWTRGLFFAWSYFVVSLFPMLGFFDVAYFRHSFVADHFQYLACMGPLALAGSGIARSLEHFGRRKTEHLASCGFMLLALAYLTWWNSRLYADTRTLYERTLARNPGSWVLRNGLGNLALEKGDVEGALMEFRRVVQTHPKDADGYFNLGLALMKKGEVDEAAEQYRKALALRPNLAIAHNNLGMALVEKGEVEEAIGHYRKALEIKPRLADAQNNLGVALARQGKIEEAMAAWHRTLEIDPRYAKAHHNIGLAFAQQSHLDEAITQWQKAVALDAGFAEAHSNLATALAQMGRTDEAVAHLRKEADIEPHNGRAQFNLAAALVRQGHTNEAIAHYRTGLESEPQDVKARLQFVQALTRKGRAREAVEQFEQAMALEPVNPAFSNELAWVLATCPDASVRNGSKAVELAQKSVELSGGSDPAMLDTLAAAFAEADDFPSAIKAARRALELARTGNQPQLAGQIVERLKLYEAGTPFREAAVPAGTP
jgi:protein O-mannosyl-transferase